MRTFRSIYQNEQCPYFREKKKGDDAVRVQFAYRTTLGSTSISRMSIRWVPVIMLGDVRTVVSRSGHRSNPRGFQSRNLANSVNLRKVIGRTAHGTRRARTTDLTWLGRSRKAFLRKQRLGMKRELPVEGVPRLEKESSWCKGPVPEGNSERRTKRPVCLEERWGMRIS